MLRRFFNFFRPDHLEAEMREELEFHRSQTSGSLGNVTLIRDRMRDASTINWLETTWRDLRYGIRQLRKAPVLVAVAMLSLALGIGANTAIFTLIDAVMLQSLPVRDPGHLVLFNDDISTGVYSGDDFPSNEFSYPSFQYLQAHNDSFVSLCAFRQNTDRVVMHIAGTSEAGPQQRANAHLVSGNYFETLGVNAALGRLLNTSDDTLSAARVAVISYGFWRDRFNLDRSVLGRSVVLNDVSFTIVGVTDSSFFGERIENAPDFWLPLSTQPQVLQRDAWSNSRAKWLTARDVYWLNFMGRLKPGVSLESAQASVNIRLRQFYSEQAGSQLSPATRRKIENIHVELKPGGGGISGLRYLYSKPLHILMAVVALVLLIACANVATLLLARASARRQEFLARLALGASRTRLLRQVLTESVLLSVLGGMAGAAFAWWCVRLLVILLHFPAVAKVRPDPAVLGFAVLLSVLSGILFGIVPAIKFSRLDPRPANAARMANFGHLRFTGQHALVALQVALSLILLLGAGLLVHSLLALENQQLGFRRENILLVGTDADLAGYQPNKLFTLYRTLDERLNQLSGVISASVARFAPESGNTSYYKFAMAGYSPGPDKKMDLSDLPVGPHFFETLGMPLLLGRGIDARDTPESTPVAVVNETFVRQYSPNQNPIGRRISLGSPFKEPGFEIVGVVADSKYHDLRGNVQPMGFFSIWQRPVSGFELVLRTSGAPGGIASEVRRVLDQTNSRLPVLNVTSLNAQVEQSLKQQKTITSLCSIFGVLALILASIGIYGTLAYSVAGRVSEIGIRMAIGAQRQNVIWLVLRDSTLLIAIGVFVGLPLALGGTRWIKSFLFGVPALDPLAIAGAVLLILLLASFAAYLPARRAARIDPIRALRHE
ncbi:MAG TPA: ABC transporter permease [Bryobacteraceae bacterium]|nr:ABC transporter permease [Bryobacteraceae bacterium]